MFSIVLRCRCWVHVLKLAPQRGPFLCHGEGDSPAPKNRAAVSSACLKAVSILNHWIGKITCFSLTIRENRLCSEAVLIAFLVLTTGQWRPPSLVLQCHEYPPFGFHSSGTVSLLPLRLWWWLNCLLTAYLFFSEVSYFSYRLKNTAAGGMLPFSSCQVAFQPSWQQVSPEGSSFGLHHFERDHSLELHISHHQLPLMWASSDLNTKGCIHLPWLGHLKVI